MKTLDLYKIFEVCNTLSEKESELSEKNIFVSLLGNSSDYCTNSFESFLEYYSFKVERDGIIVFNNDNVPYETYQNSDFSYVPTVLLSFSAERLENWMKIEIDLQLERQKREKEQEKEYIKLQIEKLKKRLDE